MILITDLWCCSWKTPFIQQYVALDTLSNVLLIVNMLWYVAMVLFIAGGEPELILFLTRLNYYMYVGNRIMSFTGVSSCVSHLHVLLIVVSWPADVEIDSTIVQESSLYAQQGVQLWSKNVCLHTYRSSNRMHTGTHSFTSHVARDVCYINWVVQRALFSKFLFMWLVLLWYSRGHLKTLMVGKHCLVRDWYA